FLRDSVASSTSALIYGFRLLRSLNDHRLLVNMTLLTDAYFAIRASQMEVRKSLFHIRRRDHLDILDSQRLEDILFEIIIQAQARDSHHKLACPVDIDAIFPFRAR